MNGISKIYKEYLLIAETILSVFQRTFSLENEETIAEVRVWPRGIIPTIGILRSSAFSSSHLIQELWLAYIPEIAKTMFDLEIFSARRLFI